MDGLTKLVQEDFSAGSVPAVAPHLIPSNGFYRGVDVLLDEDGSAYKRGGTTMKSNAAFSALGLRFLWDGVLAGGARTVFADPNDFGTLAVDDATPVNVGGAGLTVPVKPVALAGMLFVGAQVYGGSRKAAAYSTGTVAVTQGSTTVTGTGTAWLANADAGMLFRFAGTSRVYAVKQVVSDTQLILAFPVLEATAAGQTYAVSPILTTPANYKTSDVMETVAGRLVTCIGSKAYVSVSNDPATTTVSGIETVHEIADGTEIIGAAAIRDTLFLFTTQGLYAVSNMSFDLVDDFGNVQQRLDRVSSDLILWSNEGVAMWNDALVVPAIDGVWLVGGDGGPELLSRSITPVYVNYVRSGYRTGLAQVFKGHYWLPILDAAGVVIDMLVCRLDRPAETRLGIVFPWTYQRGAGGNLTAVAARVGSTVRQPELYGADRSAGSRVVKIAPFTPDGPRVDHDGSAINWEIVLRDVATGSLNTNMVKKVRVRYELIDTVAVATLQAYYGTDLRSGTLWGQFKWGQAVWTSAALAGFAQLTNPSTDAPEDGGSSPFVWVVNRDVRYFRLRLASTSPASRFVLRSVELFVRDSGRP